MYGEHEVLYKYILTTRVKLVVFLLQELFLLEQSEIILLQKSLLQT